ncbi:permease of the drug/metabolite transporter (DMT) superfamily [Desulforapulum autotrophicum HRM2]|uniref:Permease of the drug/metabolite transporter (DMT) superfamily n=1 Tax=Desulforapulum autotrophicum (strain ATCC 43914 / DSM 3382 / VKM B-1955 / HRM2) TaxID=177437 RepID=C0QCF4_DESAH|nr:EamA family transporter [Desulforapulum autotrophicum]ACN17171.1 permease of the drug/metabolite transporter (DMT) superfamily [Desulforapulum autotrophicum HRM2]
MVSKEDCLVHLKTVTSSLKTDDSATQGYLYIACAAILWASGGAASKALFNAGVTPEHLVQMRLTLASAVFFVWMKLVCPDRLKISPGDLPSLILLGVFGIATVQYTYLVAISKINVASAILLQYQAPALMVVFSVFVLKEKIRLLTLGAILFSTLGCYLVVGAYDLSLLSMNRLGMVAGLVSACAFAFYTMYGEYWMQRYHAITVIFYSTLIAAMAWNLVQQPLGAFEPAYTFHQWLLIALIAIPGTVVAFTLYFKGINIIRSARAGITATLEPIAAGAIAYLFLGEILAPLQMLGGLIVIGVVIVLQLDKA